jgi:DNA repair exonuclease SbcCD ATPase subunit
MNRVTIHEVIISGFKSFYEETIIEFAPKNGKPDFDRGFFFLGGRNEVKPRLGANGAGKSSLWDAIFWCFYGTSIKGEKASDLTSWGHKRPQVAVTLEIAGEIWTIDRTGSPEKIMLHNFHHQPDPASQEEIDQLLGLTKARFAQSVLFGQGARLFLDLTVPERGALLEEVLDLALWERLAVRAGKEAKHHELNKADALRDIAFVSGKLEGLVETDLLVEQETRWRENLEAELLRLCEDIEGAQAVLDKANNAIPNLPVQNLASKDHINLLRGEIGGHQQRCALINREASEIAQSLQFYETHTDCPTCSQPITAALIKDKQKIGNTRLALISIERNGFEAEIERLSRELRTEESAVQAQQQEAQQCHAKHAGAVAEANAARRMLDSVLANLDRKEAELKQSPFAAQIAQQAATKAKLEEELASHKLREVEADRQFRHADYWRNGFKKVKLFLIKKTLSMLEVETAAAASALGMTGISIKFVTETETKSGGLKSGVQILVTDPDVPGKWSIWSGGEGQRIRLAVSLGLANMIQRMAGVDYNLEVFDEPSAWLSPEGISDLMECLHHRADMTGKAVWVVDHRVFDATTFDGIWTMVKTKAGSHLEIN